MQLASGILQIEDESVRACAMIFKEVQVGPESGIWPSAYVTTSMCRTHWLSRRSDFQCSVVGRWISPPHE